MSIDLHTHTTASDGSFTPSQLVHHAKEKGLRALAVTDHDTIDGNEEALNAGMREGLEVVPGIEISVDYSPGSMHMLGYFIDTESQRLQEKLALLQDSRSDRNPKIIEKLNALGLDITYDEVVEASGGGQVGRPHIAQVLLQKGYTTTIQEAFDKYLGKGAPAYFDKFRLNAVDAIAMITDAGGVPVLAHPFTLQCKNQEELEGLIKHLTGQGLQGIEVYYTEHNEKQISRYRLLAERNNLLLTGGSDFHGANMAGVELGTGRGTLQIPYSLFENLKTHWEEGKDKLC
jgi:predicted metal-dependent phosphoesterase TrpH